MTWDVDREIVQKLLAGDSAAFAELIDRYGRHLYARILRQVRSQPEAEDLLQEVFLTAYTHLAQVRDGERLAGWLAAIADNQVRGWQRRRWVQMKWQALLEPGDWAAEDPEVEDAHRRELRHQVRQALNRLSERERQVIVHHYFGGYTYLETASLLGVRVDTVRSRLQKGRNHLKKEMVLMAQEGIQPQGFALTAKDLRALLWATRFVSHDPQRPVLQGIYLDAGGKIVATDGFRLFYREMESLKPLKAPLLLGPWQGVELPETGEATLAVGSQEVVLRCTAGPDYLLPVMEGPYVKYPLVIPPEGRLRLQIEAGLLHEAIEHLAAHLGPRHPLEQAGVQGYTPQVELQVSALEQTLSLRTTRYMGYEWKEGKRSPAAGMDWTVLTSVPVQVQGSEPGEHFRIGVNHTYLHTAAQALAVEPGQYLDLHFTDPLQAIQFTAPTQPGCRVVQMPLRLQTG
jgi:RNA polymerase sigma-70 factor (ECF subfamily)